jgi:hypothetical protein
MADWMIASIDGRQDTTTSAKTVAHCAQLMQKLRPFKKAMLFGCQPPRGNFPVEYVRIPPLDHKGYSFWSIRELWRYVDADFILTVQPDGYILNPQYWSEDFLSYDYIGAPWTLDNLTSDAKHCQVGNGGFCIRSRRFCEETAKTLRPYRMENDDVYFCQRMRVEGCFPPEITFAPLEVACRFAIEWGVWPKAGCETFTQMTENDTFGFHGTTGGRRVKLNDSPGLPAPYEPVAQFHEVLRKNEDIRHLQVPMH